MSDEVRIYGAKKSEQEEGAIAQKSVAAGFPSPADDFKDIKLDLNRELIKNPASTFFARVSGTSMSSESIDDGDLLVIDRSIDPVNGSLLVCYIDGEFTLKRFDTTSKDEELTIWGVVRYLVKKM